MTRTIRDPHRCCHNCGSEIGPFDWGVDGHRYCADAYSCKWRRVDRDAADRARYLDGWEAR